METEYEAMTILEQKILKERNFNELALRFVLFLLQCRFKAANWIF